MFYPKNVPNWERVIRFLLSIVLVVIAVYDQALFGEVSVLRAVLLVGSAILLTATAFIGWCPACALAGRKLKQKQSREA